MLTKLNQLCDSIIAQMKGDKSIDPAPQKAEPNKSLTDTSSFNDKDDTAADQKVQVPNEFARKYKRKAKKS